MESPSPLAARFTARVRALCEANGRSVNWLADFSGLSRGYVSELLRDQKVPTLTTVEKIAVALDVNPCVLLCGNGSEIDKRHG